MVAPCDTNWGQVSSPVLAWPVCVFSVLSPLCTRSVIDNYDKRLLQRSVCVSAYANEASGKLTEKKLQKGNLPA